MNNTVSFGAKVTHFTPHRVSQDSPDKDKQTLSGLMSALDSRDVKLLDVANPKLSVNGDEVSFSTNRAPDMEMAFIKINDGEKEIDFSKALTSDAGGCTTFEQSVNGHFSAALRLCQAKFAELLPKK